MANEADVLLGEHDKGTTYYTIADATAVPKGTLLVQSETATRTVVVHSAGYQIPVGFAVSEKEASDGQTEIGIQRLGLCKPEADDTVDEGDLIIPGETTANQVQAFTGQYSKTDLRCIMGIALQAAAADAKFLMRLRL